MLVLSRKIGESIQLADNIEITVLAIDNQRVRLGIRAPREVTVRRAGGPGETVISGDIPPDEANRQAALSQVSAPADIDPSILSKAAKAQSQQEETPPAQA